MTEFLTSEKEEDEDHNHGVAKVQYGTGRSNYLQLWEEVVHGVDEQIDCGESAGQEGAPPPMVVLDTQDKSWHVRIQQRGNERRFGAEHSITSAQRWK